MTTTASARVAVVATPFGFGPAAKAYSIGSLLAHDYNLDVRYHGSACALDFFVAQDLDAYALREGGEDYADGCDAVVNVLAPELILSEKIAAQTYYVDSLGFMWQSADIPPHSLLRQVRGYYAQDLFGSAANLARLGFPRVVPVSGIVSATAAPTSSSAVVLRRGIVHLGGLGNPAGTGSAEAYLPLMGRLITELARGPYELTVAMNRTARGLALAVDVPVDQLSNAGFRTHLRSCEVVFSSPGLTTLVEAAQAERPYVPLPPQNWSQVVITGRMAQRSGLEVWSFLAGYYAGIDQYGEEMRKAASVAEINRELTGDAEFAARYGVLALRAAKAAVVPALGAPFDGASQIAAAVAADLGAKAAQPVEADGSAR